MQRSLDDDREPDEPRRDYAVEPPVVPGGDDGENRQDRMGDDPPAEPARREHDHTERDEKRPRDVHRGHRGELIGSRRADRRVDRLVEERGRVDEPEARGEPGRRHGDELNRERGARHQHHRVPHLRVAVAVAHERPDEERDHPGKVHGRVEDVQRLNQQARVEHRVLQGQLARQVQVLRQIEDPTTPGDGTGDVQQRKGARELPERVETEHDRRLAREGQRVLHASIGRLGEQAHDHEERDDRKCGCERERSFPGQPHDLRSVLR